VEHVLSFVDEDKTEELWCSAWSATSRGTPILVVAGKNGILKGIDCLTFKVEVILVGHGDSINELKTHPVNDQLMFSASKDNSIRLWNLRTCVCVAIFAGDKGHRAQVCSIDVNMLGNLLISGGMDTSINIWNLDSPAIREAIKKSDEEPRRPGNLSFRTISEQNPIFSTSLVHVGGYVDSIQWFGSHILSKSTRNEVVLWAPDAARGPGKFIKLREFVLPYATLWCIRTDIFVPHNIFAVGNDKGKVFVYSLSDSQEGKVVKTGKEAFTQVNTHQLELEHRECKKAVRQVAFSPNGGHLVYCCDSSCIIICTIKKR
jgi:polycomb protein EED